MLIFYKPENSGEPILEPMETEPVELEQKSIQRIQQIKKTIC